MIKTTTTTILRGCRAVLFDLDNTLIDNAEALKATFAQFWEEYSPGIKISKNEAAANFYRCFRAGHPSLPESYGDYRALACPNGSSADFPDYDGFSEFWRRVYPTTASRFPDAEDILSELKKNFPLGLITNGPPYFQNTKLDASGLRRYFDVVVISGELGIHKPDPGIFLHTAQLLGVPPGDCVYVGDLPCTDIAGARAAGMRSVWRRGFAPPPCEADAAIEQLSELPELLLY